MQGEGRETESRRVEQREREKESGRGRWVKQRQGHQSLPVDGERDGQTGTESGRSKREVEQRETRKTGERETEREREMW